MKYQEHNSIKIMVVLNNGTLFLVDSGYGDDILEDTLSYDIDLQQLLPFMYDYYDTFVLRLFQYSAGYDQLQSVAFAPNFYDVQETSVLIYVSGLTHVQNGTYNSNETLLAALSSAVSPTFSTTQEGSQGVLQPFLYRIKKAFNLVFKKPTEPRIRLTLAFKDVDGNPCTNPSQGQTIGIQIKGVRYPSPRKPSLFESPMLRQDLCTIDVLTGKVPGSAVANSSVTWELDWGRILGPYYYSHRYFKMVIQDNVWLGANQAGGNCIMALTGLPLLQHAVISANNVTDFVTGNTVSLYRTATPQTIYPYVTTGKGSASNYFVWMTTGKPTEYLIELPENRKFQLIMTSLNPDGSNASWPWPSQRLRGIIQLAFIPYR
jgi:hypothetical protein